MGRIDGVMDPFLYAGYLWATFPLHIEDADLWSVSFLHWGKAKMWYIIPEKSHATLEMKINQSFNDVVAYCPNFLRHKRTLVTPDFLDQECIPYDTFVQVAGEYIFIPPRCYHFGFCTGFNISEATNFATPRLVFHSSGDSGYVFSSSGVMCSRKRHISERN